VTAIRRARPAQAKRLSEIARAAKAHWGYPARWLRLWRKDLTVTPRFVREELVYCAVRGRAVVGFYALSRDGEDFELEHLWVRPEAIGTGAGRRLLTHATRTARDAGARRIAIASDPHAVGFYRRLGARRIGDVPSKPRGRRLPLLRLSVR
jgi:ribosomal protein S18 acetylase RimI-like enzyme